MRENKKTWGSALWVDNQFDKYVLRAQSQCALGGMAHHLVDMMKIGQTGLKEAQHTPPVLITDGNDLKMKLNQTKWPGENQHETTRRAESQETERTNEVDITQTYSSSWA